MKRFYECKDIKREVSFTGHNIFWSRVKPMEFEIRGEGLGQETLYRGKEGRLSVSDEEDSKESNL